MTKVDHPVIPSQRLMPRLAGTWRLILLRGVAGMVFGASAFIWSGPALFTLIMIYGAYALIDGVIALIGASTGNVEPMPTFWLFMVGWAGIAAGLFIFLWPGVSAEMLIGVVGAWSAVRGIFEIIGAIQLRKEIVHEWRLMVVGVLAAVFGMLVLATPTRAVLTPTWAIGPYFILIGILLVGLGLRLRTSLSHQA